MSALGLVFDTIEINLPAVTDRGTVKKRVIDGCTPAEMTCGAARARAGDLLALSDMMGVDSEGPIAATRGGKSLSFFGGAARAQ